jgi:ABC-2 type transport system permease protein
MSASPQSMTIKTLRLIPCYVWLSLLRSSEFKFSFYSYMFLYGSQIVFYVFFWQAVQPPVASGWSAEACVLLTGFGTLSVALQEIVWATGMIDQMILRGDLLVVLVRPENSYFGLVMRRMGAMALLPALMGLLLIVITLFKMDSFHILGLAAGLLCCVLGSVIMRSVLLFVNTLGFRYGKVTALKSLTFSSRDFSRYPIDILPSFVRLFFCTVFPVMVMSNWPALMAQSTDLRFIGLTLAAALGVTIFWVLFCAWFWRRGLRYYEGSSL